MGGVAGAVGGFVERKFQRVGRGRRVGGGGPAGRKCGGRGRIGPVGAFDQQLEFAPLHGGRDFRRGSAQIGGAVGHAGAGRHRLPLPLAVLLIPLIVGFDPGELPLHLHRQGACLRADADQREARVAVFGDGAVEEGLDADHRGGGFKRADQLAFDRAARPFGDAQGEARLERPGGIGDGGQGHVDRGLARRIGAQVRVERHALRGEGFVLPPEDIAGPGGEPGGGAHLHLALDGEVRARRAEEIARVERQRGHIAEADRRIGQRQREIDALGQEILYEKGRGGQRIGLEIGIGFKPPDTARGRARDRQGEDMAPRARVISDRARVFEAVGAFQDRGQRQAFGGCRCAVAGKCRRVDGFAGAVGPPVGRQEHIDGRCRLASRDAPVGKVELGVGERQEREIVGPVAHRDEGGGGAAGAARQPGIEAGIAGGVGRGVAEHRVRAAEKLHLRAGLGRGRREAAHEDMKPVHARHRGQTEVGHDEPLPGRGHVIGIGAGGCGAERVDAGRAPRDGLAHRQAGGHVAVDLHRDVGGAVPERLAHVAGEAFLGIGLHRVAEIAVLDGAEHIAVGDRVKREVERFGVDRLHRDRRPAGARQHVGAPRKAGGWLAVAHVLRDRHRFREALPVGCGQPLAEGHGVAAAVLHALDAKLPPAAGRDGQPGIGELHVVGVVGALGHQIVREGGADAGAGTVAFDGVLGDAEAVFADRVVERRRGVVARLDRLREAQRLHRVGPPIDRFERLPHDGERGVALGRRGAAQVGVDGCGQRPVAESALVLAVGLACGQEEPRVIGPALGRVGEIERGPGELARAVVVAVGLGLGGRLEVLGGRPGAGDMGVGEIVGLLAGLREIVVAEKGQLGPARRCCREHRRIGGADAPRIGTGIGHGIARPRLGKAGSVLRIEGEGGAAVVGEAGPLAGLERGVEHRRQIAAGQVRILGQHEPPFRYRCGLCKGCGAEREQEARHCQREAAFRRGARPNSRHAAIPSIRDGGMLARADGAWQAAAPALKGRSR